MCVLPEAPELADVLLQEGFKAVDGTHSLTHYGVTVPRNLSKAHWGSSIKGCYSFVRDAKKHSENDDNTAGGPWKFGQVRPRGVPMLAKMKRFSRRPFCEIRVVVQGRNQPLDDSRCLLFDRSLLRLR